MSVIKRFLFAFTLLAPGAVAQAESLEEYARTCDKFVGGTVPSFSCLDGAIVPIINKQGSRCANPSNLKDSCNEFSRVGKLESGDPNVEIRFMCRHYTESNSANDTNFNDIAVIQHNKSTGATCFYQSPVGGPLDGSRVPAPRTGDTKIFQQSAVANGSCASCHDNRGFIKTAHLKGVTGYHEIPAPPRETTAYRFPGQSTSHWRVYSVKANNNPTCSSCHTIGAFGDGNGFMSLGGSSGSLGLSSAQANQANLLAGTRPWMDFGAASASAHNECANNHFNPGCDVRMFEAPSWDDTSEEASLLIWAQLTSDIQVKAGEEIGRITYTATGGDGLITYSVGHPNDECSWDWPRPEGGQMILSGRAPTEGRYTLNGKELQPGANVCNIRLIAESAGQRAELDIRVTITNDKGGMGPQDGQIVSLRSRHSGKCLDLRDWNTNNGTDLQQWDCNGGNAQKFRLQGDGKGAFALVNIHANKCVSVQDFVQTDGGRVHSWDCYGNTDQKYRFVPNAFPGTYSLHFLHSDKCLDVSGPSYDNGAIVHQWSCINEAANQAWELLP